MSKKWRQPDRTPQPQAPEVAPPSEGPVINAPVTPLISLPPRAPELPVTIPPPFDRMPSPPVRFAPNPAFGEIKRDVSVDDLIAGVAALRKFRDERTYATQGYHSFREWTVNKFGVNLGCWIDEIL